MASFHNPTIEAFIFLLFCSPHFKMYNYNNFFLSFISIKSDFLNEWLWRQNRQNERKRELREQKTLRGWLFLQVKYVAENIINH